MGILEEFQKIKSKIGQSREYSPPATSRANMEIDRIVMNIRGSSRGYAMGVNMPMVNFNVGSIMGSAKSLPSRYEISKDIDRLNIRLKAEAERGKIPSSIVQRAISNMNSIKSYR